MTNYGVIYSARFGATLLVTGVTLLATGEHIYHELLQTVQVSVATLGLRTRPIGFGFVWEKLFGLERSARLQLCLRELRQVGHH